MQASQKIAAARLEAGLASGRFFPAHFFLSEHEE
jgi:hypothetical protein